MSAKSCCFTGHRNIPSEVVPAVMERTEFAIRTLVADGVTQYLVGGAVGYDTLVAELLFQLREEFSQIEIILAYPFDGFTDGWTDDQRATYTRLLPLYDKRVCVAPAASREAFLVRDRYMVDHSGFCISYCTRNSGGSAYTVRYARKKGIPVIATAQL